MLHSFLASGYWFAPKTYGYGAGWPIAWQGWALLGAYMALVLGIALMAPALDPAGMAMSLVTLATATLALTLIARKRTRGGWRWRWGARD